MKTVLVVLGTIVLICFNALRVDGSVYSTEFDTFIRDGFLSVTGVSSHQAALTANGEEYATKKKTYEITCNGEPFDGTECVGKLMINTTVIKSDDEIKYYGRCCEGKFTNETIDKMENMYEMNTVQCCKGKSIVYMETKKKCKETGTWKKKYFYSKSCFSKYIMLVKPLPPIPGAYRFEVATVCETAAETIKMSDMKSESSEKKESVVSTTCNCKETSFDKPCQGRFEMIMEKKMEIGNYGRRLTEEANSKGSWKSKDKTWTFICDGKWVPYGKALYECEGMKQEYTDMEGYHSSKNCTGIYGAGMFKEKSGGFSLCNGINTFAEDISIPFYGPTSPSPV
eukprot:g561.t1